MNDAVPLRTVSDMVAVQLSAVDVRIVQHTDMLVSSIATSASDVRTKIFEEAAHHPLVLETSLQEQREVSGSVVDVTVSHTVAVTAGGILLTVLATGTLVLHRTDPLGDEW